MSNEKQEVLLIEQRIGLLEKRLDELDNDKLCGKAFGVGISGGFLIGVFIGFLIGVVI